MLPQGLPPVLSLAVSADQFCLPVMLKICIEADLTHSFMSLKVECQLYCWQ